MFQKRREQNLHGILGKNVQDLNDWQIKDVLAEKKNKKLKICGWDNDKPLWTKLAIDFSIKLIITRVV